MRILFARYLSIAGHPLLLVPAAALWLAASRQVAELSLYFLILVLLIVIVATLTFSIWNLWFGRWAHIDASKTSERQPLNGFVGIVLFITAVVVWQIYPIPELVFGLLISGFSIIIALAFSSKLKISLHTCFAVIAVGLHWPDPYFVILGAVIIAAVAWSRLVLRRHTYAEVCFGVLLGVLNTVVYHTVVL